eukprot:10426588-Alexandrium_andersonii.AAC.1
MLAGLGLSLERALAPPPPLLALEDGRAVPPGTPPDLSPPGRALPSSPPSVPATVLDSSSLPGDASPSNDL